MKTILVVDDDSSVRDTFSDALTEAGYLVRTATTGKDALEQLRRHGEHDPCLVILDIMMPEMTGVELLAELAKEGRLSSLAVVVMSGHAQQARGMGAVQLIRKPVSLQSMLAVVRDVCGEGDGAPS